MLPKCFKILRLTNTYELAIDRAVSFQSLLLLLVRRFTTRGNSDCSGLFLFLSRVICCPIYSLIYFNRSSAES